MSSPSRSRPALVFAAFTALAVSVSACTVQPLYRNESLVSGAVAGTQADLASISIKPVRQRYEQQVRNQLIFLFNHGANQPTVSRYTLALSIAAYNEAGAVVQVAEENEPTAGTVTLAANYVLSDTASGTMVAKGYRQISSAYDIPRQEFAAIRAERDAQDRAARELAELLRLSIAQDLKKVGATAPVALK